MKTETIDTLHTPIVSRSEWLSARLELLKEERELTHLRDRLSQRRRELPRTRVDKAYVFETEGGKTTLADLFQGRSQLIVYHFMFGPGWEEGCKGCSFVSDTVDGMLPHLNARDVTYVAVSRAPLAEILPFKKRMGWQFPWVSSQGTSFNRDFGVTFSEEELSTDRLVYNYGTSPFPPMEEAPGLSVFLRDPEEGILHTYSTYSRGLDILINTYNYLDLTPKGRDEGGLEMPMSWLKHHDNYGA
ncbi:hypothetical protein GALL_125820 [mine drainage metagenome]|uniref:DUF899 domain-containing protein n=1 Tax=mine drainage metagenome TaxID=410659 RepID=A0A1J5SZ41_9ZZZZ